MDACDTQTPPARKQARTIGRRACDACKIRKIRCSEIPPCDRCHKNGLTCTFNKAQAVRGPRHLREKTIKKIERARAHPSNGSIVSPERTAASDASSTSIHDTATVTITAGRSHNGVELRIPIPALAFRLGIYRLRLFPVWPIISVGKMLDALHSDPVSLETYVLANAVGAATMAQLKLQPGGQVDDTATAAEMEAECRRARLLLTDGEETLYCLCTAFFLHIYYENEMPGGARSLLYLREALTLAQILGLHREETYGPLPVAEQQLRRRIFWLLFVTERGVAILHSFPVVLRRSNVAFPSLQDATAEDSAILPAFRELVHMFYLFDQSGVFELLAGNGTAAPAVMHLLQTQLRDLSEPMEQSSLADVQRADLAVTRMWMQAVLWKLAHGGGTIHPLVIARELLWLAGRLPSSAIEAHGPAVEFKIYEIANAVIDTVGADVGMMDSLIGIVGGLQTLLAGCRGGNQRLLASLDERVAELGSRSLGANMAISLQLASNMGLWENGDAETVFDTSLPSSMLALLQGPAEVPDSFQDNTIEAPPTPSLTDILEELGVLGPQTSSAGT